MKKIYYNLAIMLAAVAMVSCGEEKKGDEPTPGPVDPDAVEVSISTTDIQTKAAITEFKSGAEMNIFAKTYGRIDAPNIVDGVKATFDGSKWTMSPRVMIDGTQKNAFVYAVAPYDASYTDAGNIPVDLNKQVDLMYSGAYVPASLKSPAVKLTMKHALSLLTFNIVPVNGSANQLKSIKLNGETFYTSGSMDVSTGKIKLDKTGAVKVDFNKNFEQGGWKNSIPGIWTLPFNTKAGVVNVEVIVDDKTYNIALPEVEVKQGYQYIFRLALTRNGIEFDPSKTETISLNVDEDAEQNFEGYGCVTITADGSTVYTPEFTGDAVFGTTSTPSGHTSYTSSTKVEGLSKGQKVTVETWNSTGFTMETLEGVERIDLSQYD